MEIILGRCKNVYVYVFKRTEIRHHDRIRSARPGPTFALPSGGFWNHFVERIEVIAALSCSNSRAKKPSRRDRGGYEVAHDGDPGLRPSRTVVDKELGAGERPFEDLVGDPEQREGGPAHGEALGLPLEILFPGVLSGVPREGLPLHLPVMVGFRMGRSGAHEPPDLFEGSVVHTPFVADEDHGCLHWSGQISLMGVGFAFRCSKRARRASLPCSSFGWSPEFRGSVRSRPE